MIAEFTNRRILSECPFKSNQRPAKLRMLTPRCDAHREVWLSAVIHLVESDSTVWCTPGSLTPQHYAHRGFLKIRISRRNRNPIWNYFSLFTKDHDGFKSRKKNKDRKSRDDAVKENTTCNLIFCSYPDPELVFTKRSPPPPNSSRPIQWKGEGEWAPWTAMGSGEAPHQRHHSASLLDISSTTASLSSSLQSRSSVLMEDVVFFPCTEDIPFPAFQVYILNVSHATSYFFSPAIPPAPKTFPSLPSKYIH